MILHLHERRLRVAPPANSYAAKDIEDLEFYMKRLNFVEGHIHQEYAPKLIETHSKLGLGGKFGNGKNDPRI